MPDWISEHFRIDALPHIWCPGCGHGTTMGALVRAIDRAGVDRERCAIVSGIGCSSRAPGYMNYDTLHTTHGRALAFATGLKVARPDITVIVVTGDGDLAAIGGNHFIHAARRNIDLTILCMNNNIYGMTGGQASPMTPSGKLATTTPYGASERPFDLCKLAEASGATYVARGTSYHVTQTERWIADAIEHNGFSFVEAVGQCPTYYGRRNKLRTASDMLNYFKDNSVTVKRSQGMDAAELRDKFIIGQIHRSQAPEFVAAYDRVAEQVRREG